jgi:predicted ATP-grasp superfamily ATP-dependent carboligase
MKTPISVLILDGQGPYALVAARCLVRAPGVRLHVLSLTDRALVRRARWIASFELMPVLPDDAARLNLVEEVVRRKGIDVILGTSEDAIDFISANRAALDRMCATVATPGRKELAVARDKWLLSCHMSQNGIPHPETCLVTDGTEFESAVKALKPPLILKPAQGSGGEGMVSFAGHETLLAHIRNARSRGKRFIVQTLVGGRDGGCNVLCRDGKILVSTVQKAVVANSRPFGSPSCVDVVPDEEVLSLVARLMSSLNWSGAVNVDLKLDERDHSVTVLEINPRYWGSLLASLFAGVNFPYLACLEGMGIALPDPDFRPVRFTWNERKVIAGFLARRGAEKTEVRGSVLRYVIPDPLPEIIEFGRRVFQR